MRDTAILLALAAAALLLMAIALAPSLDKALSGHNDFLAFYAAARLLDTGELYDNERLREVSQSAAGAWSPEHGVLRPPFHAVLIWPFARLPYVTAYRLWALFLIACFAGFVALWRPPRFLITLTFSMLSLPVFTAIANGQDSTLALLALAGSVRLHQRERALPAGLVLSLCAIKFHLFLLTPLLLLARREWNMVRGFLAGAVTLTVVSFAAAGWDWPWRLARSVLDPAFSPRPEGMPNFHGVLVPLLYSGTAEAVLALAVAAAVWYVASRTSFLTGMAAALAGGLLVSHHAYYQDVSILLPAGLAALATARGASLRIVAVLLMVIPVAFNESTAEALVKTIALVAAAFLALLVREASGMNARRALDNSSP